MIIETKIHIHDDDCSAMKQEEIRAVLARIADLIAKASARPLPERENDGAA